MSQCEFGKCTHYCTCEEHGKEDCNRFRECHTYMDKYDNDMGLWADLHGESNYDECDYADD